MSYGVKKIEPIFICKTAGNIYATETFFRVRGGQALPGLCIPMSREELLEMAGIEFLEAGGREE